MPAYEYHCEDCGKEFTVFLSMRDYEAHPQIKCPHCGGDKVRRTITAGFLKTSKKS